MAHVIKGIVPVLRESYSEVSDEPLPKAFELLARKLLTGPLGRQSAVTARSRPVVPIVARQKPASAVPIASPSESESRGQTNELARKAQRITTQPQPAADGIKPKRKPANAPTMVVVRVPVRDGLLMVRQTTTNGLTKPALPSGVQLRGETWQETGAREVFERTGVKVEPQMLRLLSVVTAPDRRQNIIFCQSPPSEHLGEFGHCEQAGEVLVSRAPVETMLPLHTVMVADFFRCRFPQSRVSGATVVRS
ncbi:hypothetical protein MGN01_46100 [Methylobacterium gnaphalii]|uniref:Nudix hydrolase domain-containing protein n=2 Tax=Methylobacterium gnaphalii TaxID=1010610 RepID=A0A512JS37_9HYPH|nr:hypothetical protein MGN01_46100 [Methylobacterium gnaphalii]GLS48599.1 hypothetical protein GCM10007885_14430 [Methylobacterium gnaphalii]